MNLFSNLPLSESMLTNLDSLEYKEMTPIQAQSLPLILQGVDIIGKAKTGSGKTAAFAIGLLHQMQADAYHTQALVLCPTRELADQVAKEIRRLARMIPNIKVLTLCGGVSIGPQLASLERGAHIVVGTPGRLVDHLRKNSLQLNQIKQLVLDEADRMLDMGFSEDIDQIIAACPDEKQTLLFSATYPKDIEAISKRCQKNPQMVSVETTEINTAITQAFFEVSSSHDKLHALLKLLAEYKPKSCIVFCNTKQTCNEVLEFLQEQNISSVALHGDLEQKQRDQVLVRFANRSVSVLIATDVAARGLDIKQLDAVINFDLARDSEVHIHRVGRTGRAGETGIALNLISPQDLAALNRLENFASIQIELKKLPASKPIVDLEPEMVTLNIDGGKKDKLRAGDILGALTKDAGIGGDKIGKIDIFDFAAYVAIERSVAHQALKQLQTKPLKGKQFRARKL
ncbi:MAG: ATP-dependent RNA helicase DbpA [Cellvibrio sp.]|nr:ATP-dependent RNA helicase DbpA [Cellvibrio sp.]